MSSSGKTLAFGVPALQHVYKHVGICTGPLVLVIAPTRELAMQTHETLAAFGAPLGIAAVCVYGGVDKSAQRRALTDGAKIVSGTPGRLLDLAGEGALDLSQVSYLVLDEADRMLDKGFEHEVRQIIGLCQTSEQGRQTAMFSATWPNSVRRLAEDFMRDPVRITVGSDELTSSTSVQQSVQVLADGRKKDGTLLDVLRDAGLSGSGGSRNKALVFALYKKEATRVHAFLVRHGYQAGCIQGDLSQATRTAALAAFKNGETGVLVATDVAARGLDIPKVELVVNYTFPCAYSVIMTFSCLTTSSQFDD